LIYTTTVGCTAKTIVTVNPQPLPIEGDANFCATAIDTLINPTPGGVWSSLTPGVATIDAATGVVTTVSGGTAIIRYTLTATGCSVTKSFPIQSIPGPVVTFNGATNTFYTSQDYYAYQWYNSVQGLIPGANTYSTAGLWDGLYYVVVTDSATGCKGASAKVAYTQSMGAGSITQRDGMKVYPNPTSEAVYIQSSVPVRAVISSMDGKKLIEQDNAKRIDISKLANGVYTITIYDHSGAQLQVQKLVKE